MECHWNRRGVILIRRGFIVIRRDFTEMRRGITKLRREYTKMRRKTLSWEGWGCSNLQLSPNWGISHICMLALIINSLFSKVVA